jgi:hypothetical protein
VSARRLAPGKHFIHFDFKYDGGGAGKGATGILSVDGQQVAQGRIDRTIRARMSLDETMDFGEDTGTPVVEDYADRMPFKFTGTLDRFVVQLGEPGETTAVSSHRRQRPPKTAARVVPHE